MFSSSVTLEEADVSGALLSGRKPSGLKTEELKFWLKCKGDPGKGLKTKAELVKRWEIALLFFDRYHSFSHFTPGFLLRSSSFILTG